MKRLLVLLGVLATAACGGGDDGNSPKAVADVNISAANVTLAVGQTRQLSATPVDADGNALERNVTWSSTNDGIATVSAAGLVSAHAQGAATIRAASGGKTGEVPVAVGPATTPQVTAIDVPLLTPGVVARITGTNFGTSPADNVVTIDGVAAQVTAATPTQLTVTVPTTGLACAATHDAVVSVTAGGGTGSATRPLQTARQVSLSVGQALVVQAPGEVRCNELAQNGGRYMIAVFNTNDSKDAVLPFVVRGSAATALLAAPMAASTYASASAATPVTDAPRARAASPLDPVVTRRASAVHARMMRSWEQLRGQHLVAPARRSGAPGVRFAVAPPTVGSIITVKVPDLDDIRKVKATVRARVAYVGTRSIILEDETSPLAGQIDATFQALGEEFDNVVYPLLKNNFGDPLAVDARTDNNGRIQMLFSPNVNQQGGVYGFVTPYDFLSPTQYPASNQAEMFYALAPTSIAGANSGVNLNLSTWRRVMRSTIVHEVKHVASFAEHFTYLFNNQSFTTEEAWLEEGMALHAEELYWRTLGPNRNWKGNVDFVGSVQCEYANCGGDYPLIMSYHFGQLYDYLKAPDQRTLLGPVTISPTDNDGSFYGSSWLFVRWLVDNYVTDEATFFKAITKQQADAGIPNIEHRTGKSFDNLLAEWALAMVLDDAPGFTPAAGSKYVVPSWNMRSIYAGMNSAGLTPVAFPLVPRVTAYGNFSNSMTLRGGGIAWFDLSGTQGAKQLVEVASQGGGNPDQHLRVEFIRLQ